MSTMLPPSVEPDEPSSADGARASRNERSTSRRWTRTAVNFVLDAALLLTFVTIVGTATIVRFVFPATHAAAGWTLWGWSLGQWIDFWFGTIAVFTLAVLLHVMLHWNWVCGVIATKLSKWKRRPIRIEEGGKTLWGVGLLILILNGLGLLIAIATFMIRRPGS